MPYSDVRDIEAKLLEHRFWNTLEFEFDSAAEELAIALTNGLRALPRDFSWDAVGEAFLTTSAEADSTTLLGMIRLFVFAACETPNRFKALFPAFLMQNGHAEPSNRGMSWTADPRRSSATITIEDLSNIMIRKNTKIAVDSFLSWAKTFNSEEVIRDFLGFNGIPSSMIKALSFRLAQGADTNRRGHGATDLLKSRISEWGFTPAIGNTNATDIPASTLINDYGGPRKFDTVLWNAIGHPVIVSQSQVYSSDVGSIQGKTIEEDALANSKMKEHWPEVVILTHTEGFGCHTTMRARLVHVLRSNIDGFIQIKTLDTKLRHVLRTCLCTSLLDIEFIISELGAGASVGDVISFRQKQGKDDTGEIESAIKHYKNAKLLDQNQAGQLRILDERKPIAAYYFAVDAMFQAARPLASTPTPYIRIGGCPQESAISKETYQRCLAHAYEKFGLDASIADDIAEKLDRRGVISIVE